jgi:RES domain-containing protein
MWMGMDRLATLASLATDIVATAFWRGSTEEFDHDALVTSADGNRWNAPGEPTVYLAGDLGLALVEVGRHQPDGSAKDTAGLLWRVEVTVPRVLDLRHPEALAALELRERYWFLERGRCAEVARSLREAHVCAAIQTPSAGVPDGPDRWNLVLFPDRLPRPLAQVITNPEKVGAFVLGTLDGGVPTRTRSRCSGG